MEAARELRVSWRGRAILFACVALLLVTGWQGGIFEAFANPEKVRAMLHAWGAWAYVLFIASFAVLQPFGIPAFVWVVPAGVLWPFAIAFPLSLVAIAFGSTIGFFFARYVGREWVAARLPQRVRRYDERFSQRGLLAVMVFRMLFQVGAPTHWLLGLSRVGYGTYLAGTLLGVAPIVAVVVWLGQDVVQWVEMHGTLAFILLLAIVVIVILARILLKDRRAKDRVESSP